MVQVPNRADLKAVSQPLSGVPTIKCKPSDGSAPKTDGTRVTESGGSPKEVNSQTGCPAASVVSALRPPGDSIQTDPVDLKKSNVPGMMPVKVGNPSQNMADRVERTNAVNKIYVKSPHPCIWRYVPPPSSPFDCRNSQQKKRPLSARNQFLRYAQNVSR